MHGFLWSSCGGFHSGASGDLELFFRPCFGPPLVASLVHFGTPLGPPRGPEIAPKSDLSLPLASEALPVRFWDAPGTLRDPFWGPKREVLTLTKAWPQCIGSTFSGFQRGTRKKRGKSQKSIFKLLRFEAKRVPEGLPKFVCTVPFFRRFLGPLFLGRLVDSSGIFGPLIWQNFGQKSTVPTLFSTLFRNRVPGAPREAPRDPQGPNFS